jgi:hypothetical protein
MWPFATRIVDDEVVGWQLRAFEWLIRNVSDDTRPVVETRLVTPARGQFSSDGETGHALALKLFSQVRDYIQIDPNLDIRLVMQPQRRRSIVNERTALVHDKPEPLGLCSANADGSWTISYDGDLLKDPENLISTFVHEIGHVLVPFADDLPVEEDEYEFLIDLCVAYLGFGVFLSNTRLERVSDGEWTWWRGGGYLPVNDRIMATALFVHIKDSAHDRESARSHLRPEWRKAFDKAFRQLARFESEIARLRRLDRDLADQPLGDAVSVAAI